MAPHAEFQHVPPELAFLLGDVDLGFENLGLPYQQQRALIAAFQCDGVAVPGTTYKLRQSPIQRLALWNLRLDKSLFFRAIGNRQLTRCRAMFLLMSARKFAVTTNFLLTSSQRPNRATGTSA